MPLLEPWRRRRCARAAPAGDRRRGVQLPSAARAARCRRAACRARAVPRADRRVQGLRRALPRGLLRAAAERGGRPLTILVATSGTPAVRWRRPSTAAPASRWWCCFPRGWSPRPRSSQLTCWGDNVRSLRVRGTFDDCQRLVKQAFLDPELRRAGEPLVRQQHQSRAAAAAGGVLRRHQPRDPAPLRRAGLVHRAERQPRQRAGVPVGAPHGAADRARWSWRTTPIAPCRTTWTAATGSRAPASPPWPRRWTWAIRATWSACARSIPGSPNCARPSVPAASATRRSASASAPATSDFGQLWCPHTATAAEAWYRLSPERRAGAPLGVGVHRAPGEVPRDRRAARSAGPWRCPTRWRNCSPARRNVLKSRPPWTPLRQALQEGG